jgi:hypothetical protein
MSSAILRSKLLNLLLTDGVRKIDFAFRSFHVDIGGFMSVWSGLATGVIDVVVDTDMPRNATAEYDYRHNTFKCRGEDYGSTANEKSALVHESVHAMRDIRYPGSHGSPATWAEDEATAYIAGALFKLYAFPDADRSTYPLFAEAYEIASALKDKPGAVVPDNDAKAMVGIVAVEPDYVKKGMTFWKSSGADGV